MQPTETETDELLLICCDQLNVLPQQVLIPTRGTNDVVVARQIYQYISHVHRKEKQTFVGQKTNRHHTSVINSVLVVTNMLEIKDPQYTEAYRVIMKKINQTPAI